MPKVEAPGQSGLEMDQLSESEVETLNLAVSRGFEDTRTLDTQTFVQKLLDYKDEIRQAAEVAKAQFDAEFDGMMPQSGKFGIDLIHPGYFGYYDWDNIPTLSADSTQTWIDNSVPDTMSGSGGVNNPATVGENAVHLICGVGTYAKSPKITRLNWRLNDQPRPAINVDYNWRETDMRIKWLDTPVVLKEDDDVFAQVYANEDGADAPFLVGPSFLESKEMRILDADSMQGTGSSNIIVE